MYRFQRQHNFNAYKELFNQDTGLNADENMQLYIQYFNAVSVDALMQNVSELKSNIDRLVQDSPQTYVDLLVKTLKDIQLIKVDN